MQMTHRIESDLLERQVQVAVVGAGGSGSAMLGKLARLHMALVELGHPNGLHVDVYDADEVSPANIGRQNFFYTDVGLPKANVLVDRINRTCRTKWESHPVMVEEGDNLRANIVIGCVDSRKGRRAIKNGFEDSASYWLDLGNKEHSGQVILGGMGGRISRWRRNSDQIVLPNVADLFPEIVDPKLDSPDDGPSCSLAEALEKQSLAVNEMAANWAWNILFRLFRYGEIDHHGIFFSLESGRSNPLPVDPDVWASMGYRAVALEKEEA